MWQRWNQGTNLFEKSLDNGGSWSPLPIAYTDRNNNFSTLQSFAAGVNVAGGATIQTGDINIPNGHLYLGGNIEASGFVRATSYLYDKGRGTPIGYQQASGGNAFINCTLNSTIANDFFWLGNFIFWNFGFNVTIFATGVEVAVSLPPGFYALSTTSGACGYTNMAVPAVWYTTGAGGDYWLRVRLKDGSSFIGGAALDFRGQAILRIA